VYDATVVNVERHVYHLSEEVAGCGLGQRSSLGDVVEEIDRVVGSFEHEHEAVGPVVVVEQRDDTRDVVDLQQQRHLEWNELAVDLTHAMSE